MLNIGIPQDHVVRLGSKSTAKTASLLLHNYQKQDRLYKNRKGDWEQIDALKDTSERRLKHIETTFAKVTSPLHYRDLLEHLEFEHPEYYEALKVPRDEHGLTRVGRNGRAVDDYYLWHQWMKGWNAGVYADSPHVRAAAQIWKMAPALRQAQIATWNTELLREKVADIYEVGKQYNEGLDSLERKRNQNVGAILRSKRIIGCTTTAAAKYRDDIQAASPGVLLVEEAGEILESHIISALGSETSQLILIGDHQ